LETVKVVGKLVKCQIENIELDSEYGVFLTECQNDDLILPDILMEFYEKYNSKDILLLKVTELVTQIAVLKLEFDIQPFTLKVEGRDETFIILHKLDEINTNEIKNADELSGCGKVLTKFELGFMDYAKKFTRSNLTDFFDLNPNEIILNSVILALDDGTPTLAPKLTGRAAEIAARRAKEKNENTSKSDSY